MNVDPYAPIFVISVAAELAEMHPQTLRKYERLGLVRPARTTRSTPATAVVRREVDPRRRLRRSTQRPVADTTT